MPFNSVLFEFVFSFAIGPGAWLSSSLEGRALCFHGTKSLAQLTGEAANKVGMFGCEVVFFADILADIVEFLPSSFVVVDEFPIAFADSAVEVNTWAAISPHMGIVPYQCAFAEWASASL